MVTNHIRLFDELRRLQLQIDDDDLYLFSAQIKRIEYSYQLFQNNLLDFNEVAANDKLQPFTLSFSEPSAKKATEFLLKNLCRHLFNVISSGNLCHQHSINVTKRISEKYPEFGRTNHHELKGLLQDREVLIFTQDLYRFFFNFGVAGFAINTKLHTGETISFIEQIYSSQLVFDIAQLKTWDGWDDSSIKFLDKTIDGNLSVDNTLAEYDSVLQEINLKIPRIFGLHFRDRLSETNIVIDRHNRIRRILDVLPEHNRKQVGKKEGKSPMDQADDSSGRRFPQPANQNTYVMRYFDTSKFIWLLEQSKLYLPSLSQLPDDPFEGSLPTPDVIERARIVKNVGRDDLEEYYSKKIEQMRRSTYVSCWCLGETESVGMWQNYCDSKEGVAIRTTYRNLDKNLSNEWRFIGQVTYLDYDHDTIPDGNVQHPFMYKRKEYEEEKEIRIVDGYEPLLDLKTMRASPHTLEHLEIEINLTDLIEEIVVHPSASEEYYAQVVALVEKHAPELVDRIRWSNLRREPKF